ncbi:MAG: zinc ribbon domain-containing protein [Chlamydiales bacterium]|nr:zinc ribbon domain-containing protein [Chlamydiales bacterium]
MQNSLKTILAIQDLDIKMIRLMRVKSERKKELSKIHTLKSDIEKQVADKEEQIQVIKKDIRMGETRIKEIQERVTKLEEQQAAVKKMDEFNALTQEMTQAGRDRTNTEQQLSDLMDKQAAEEDLLVSLKENLKTTEESSVALEKEIEESIEKINEEGKVLLAEREKIIPEVDAVIFKIYERLLKNKRDRVMVPIEQRTCSGCHIVLTAQHENLVRKGDRLVFCEHCSRILYWQDASPFEGEEDEAPKRRRRRATASI